MMRLKIVLTIEHKTQQDIKNINRQVEAWR